ncbi:VTT domain-containing protein [Actinosynnema pretiosum subsp. pretiosum]|uniref:VTT domain-containing protein n=1 Tax=Actinosynnema pretiosum subsp. pretiosum TaxID=103721 RepID=A0AA45L1Z3_9PSEU|nr:Cytochrome c-type biogenesis protein DsbD, protein-disulfide reductase [Actinosynnema pretiosum subsp. pretiosum]QUF01736.1 VTT domain-containing protein [Actinosynnema pretiosum subsp. pretiosum]
MTPLLVLFAVAAVPLAPTEAVLIACGVLAASGELPLGAVIAVAAAGCTVADLVNLAIGRALGGRALARFERRAGSRAVLDWTRARLAGRGEAVLVAVRFVPGGGVVAALLVGALRWRALRFLPIAAVGSLLWSAYVGLLGYFGGTLLDDPVLALIASLAVATLIGVPAGVAVRAAQRREALRDGGPEPLAA